MPPGRSSWGVEGGEWVSRGNLGPPMTSEDDELLASRRVRRRTYFVSAGMLLLGVVLRTALGGQLNTPVMLAQVLWALGLIGLGGLVGAGWVKSSLSGALAGLVCFTSVSVIIHFTGGPTSPYFGTLLTVPLLVAMFTPDSRLPTAVSIGLMVVAVMGLNLLAGNSLGTTSPQLITYVLVACIGLYGSRTYGRLRAAEREAQQSRLVALEQLAESERLRRRAESERAQVDRLVLVGQLASGVAHEVNNPLAFVKSNLHYLDQELRGDEGRQLAAEELHALLDETRQGVLRIEQITADLRRFSREGGEGEEQGSPLEAMEEARRLASVRLRSLGEVVLDVPPALPRVRLGQRHLLQVLLNLLLNAADAVEEAVPSRRARILVRARRQQGDVRLEVEDNGAGIPQQVLPRLFEPFFTTKPPGKGTGLGLALCREYVSRAGGTLVAENRSEGGARFVLTLNEVSEAPSPL